MSYANDLFISYARDDEPWAAKVEADLKARNPSLNIFRDRTRLQAGDEWESTLLGNLKASQHLVAVWSEKAKQSGWVNAEIANFKAQAGNAQDRKFLCLVLEGENKAYASTQMLTALQQANIYSQKPHDLSQKLIDLWNEQVDKLDKVIRDKDNRIAIPWTAIALTQSEFAGLSGKENIFGRMTDPLDNALGALTSLGHTARVELQKYYGPKPSDWRPFLGSTSIKDLLQTLLNDINAKTSAIGGTQFKLQWVDFLTRDLDQTKAAAQELMGDLALVVVDPISLYSDFVQSWLPLLKSCLERENVLFVTLPPFSLPQSHVTFRDLINRAMSPWLDFYFDPPVPLDRRAPWCALNLGDATDIRRIMQSRIAGHPRLGAARDLHPVISLGS